MGELGFRGDKANTHKDALGLKSALWPAVEPLHYAQKARGGPFPDVLTQGRDWLWKTNIVPWQKLKAQGTGVMVGEWGAYNKAPRAICHCAGPRIA